MPTAADELQHWYTWSLLSAFLPARVLSIIARLSKARTNSPTIYFVSLLACGIIATPLASRFTFTWPVALYASLQLTLMTIVREERPSVRESVRHGTRLSGFLFLVLCLGYFSVLRSESLPHEWVFLIG